MDVRRAAQAALGVVTCAAIFAGASGVAHAVKPNGQDLEFILQQIKRAEHHAAGGEISGTGPNQVSSPLLPYGLRTVKGDFNNLIPGQHRFGAADQVFPRLLDNPLFRQGEPFDTNGPAPGGVENTSYTQKSGFVADSQPRVISNLIADQSTDNPAANAAGEKDPDRNQKVPAKIPGRPDGEQWLLPNTAPDVGLSAPYNSWFTLFGQFFDHGLDLTTKGNSGTVVVPLKEDDPLFVPGSPTNFMVLTRATNQAGDDGLIGTADDVHEATNTTTSFVDQNQTYTSHPSHQVFLREYKMLDGKPVPTGKLLESADGGLATWEDVKKQAREKLGIELPDTDVLNVPLLLTDDYGRFIPAAGSGLPQIVTGSNPVRTVPGNLGNPVRTTDTDGDPGTQGDAVRTGHAFLDDIAHHAAPVGDHDRRPDTPNRPLTPDTAAGGAPEDTRDDRSPATYDDELLNAHFITGDGRGNENIGLTAVHHVFHAEHNLRVDEIKALIERPGPPEPAEWKLPNSDEYSGERLFQAARFITEMEYQHLVFEEFARKVQPQVNLFAGYETDIDPTIVAEFAHTVYRFGHSMLTETVARKDKNPETGELSDTSIGLIEGFLNPEAFRGRESGKLSSKAAAGSIVRGMTGQIGNEIDEFVTGALRNNLVGLPLDLATINMARGRETGVPPLQAARRTFYDATSNSALKPYDSWHDFRLGIRHPESLVNFVAAYGRHPSIVDAADTAAKRDAAKLIVDGGEGAPADREEFLRSEGSWADRETGLNDVDFWIGGLAEKQMPFGGMLGSTFNFVFETQMEKLQDGDRFYYLSRTAGLNFLTQLEENSFAEMIMRTTDTTHLPFDVFSRPDFTFELENQNATGPILDNPRTEADESQLLERAPGGGFRFTGAEHVVFGGTGGNDKIHSSEGDDTLWGDGGDDRLEGGAGNDAFSGGDGDDILTDLFGDDNLKGGDGNDAINAGGGFDLILGGLGKDFVVGGADPKETFAGDGDDFVIAGDSSDTVFANEGNDWVEGGGQADLLQGDNGDPFQEGRTGDDVISGDGGNDDYDSEGGDDIMVTGTGIERLEGMFGFDWVTHRGDPQPANSDMNFTGLLPPDIDNIRDRFDNVEGLSGWDKADILRGDSTVAADLTDHVLANPGLIDGLSQVIGGASSFTGGNILLGGGAGDLLEGRGGNDIIDGDAWLNVRISVRNAAGDEVETVDSMKALQARVFSGEIKPGQLHVVREIKRPTPGAGTVDTAVFSDARANYDIVQDPQSSRITVTHARGTQTDGTDTLHNVERLTFSDTTVEVNPLLTNTPATGTVTISDTTPAEDAELTATRAFEDADGIDTASVQFNWQSEVRPDEWATIAIGAAFTPGDEEAGTRLRVVATFEDGDGVLESVTSNPTAAVDNVNDAPTGQPGLSDTTPQEGSPITALTGPINDRDGLQGVAFDHRWQQEINGTFSDIPGARNATFTPGQAQVGRRLRVVVSYTDGQGTDEQVTSNPSAAVTEAPDPPAAGPPPTPLRGAAPQAGSPAGSGPAGTAPRAGAGTAGEAAASAAPTLRALRVPSVITAGSGTPISVSATVPESGDVVRIRVFRLGAASAARKAVRGKLVATVYRTTPKAKRYTFRLTEKALRKLKPGRYLVEVRVGRTRAKLGPASTRTLTVRKAAAPRTRR